MRCLVTGGAGFVGSNLCETLLKKGYEVVCMDNLSTGTKDNIKFEDKNFSFVKGDANTEDLDNVFKNNNFDWVFHYAAVVGVKKTLEEPLTVLNDAHGFKRLLELSRKNDVKKVMFSSSSEVYGEPVEMPEREDGVLNVHYPYAVTKLLGEKYLEAYHQTYGLKTCSMRFFNVYGPKQLSSDYGYVAGIFIKRALKGLPPVIFGDGSATRDFVYVDDNVKASILAAENNNTNGKVFNIGTGKKTTVLEFANKVIEACGCDLKPEFAPRRDDVLHRLPDVKRMKELIGFEARTPLSEGLKKTIDYYKSVMK